MRRQIGKYLQYAFIAVGSLAFLIPVSYLAVLYLTYLDKTITTGSAYGFTIGQSKLESYRAAQAKFRAKEIAEVTTRRDRQDELDLHPFLAEEFHSLRDVSQQFDQFNHWSVWLTDNSPVLLAIIQWRGEQVSSISEAPGPGRIWAEAPAPIAVEIGDSYADVFDCLQDLSQRDGFESLKLRTGSMARRGPVQLSDDEFRFVEPYDRWVFLVDEKWGHFNTIQLRFEADRLKEIHRHRQYFELP